MKRFLLLFILMVIGVAVIGQNADFDFQSELESLLETTFAEDETVNVEQLLDELQFIRENPLNINKGTREDFQRLYFLSAFQIDNLLRYRQQYGQIYSPFELNSIEGFNPKLIQLLQAFVVFDQLEEVSFKRRTKHEMLMRGVRLIEKQKGFREPVKYEGSPAKLYFRYRLSSSNIQAGLTAEKDAGEPFFSGANPNGFDYYSGFAKIDFSNHKNQLFLGDYLVQFGQGLTAWQGFSLSKSAEVNNVAKFNQGIRSYSSTDENNYLRGAALKLALGHFEWHSFLSYKKFDANRDQVDGHNIFTSFQSSGLHRTASEIEDKNSVAAFTAGSNISFTEGRFSVGLSGIHYQNEIPLKRTEADYNQFLFEGQTLTNIGLNYRWGVNRYYFFGESAWSSTKGMATLNGLQANPADQVQLSLIYRNISKKYNAPMAGAFTEGSKVNDEQGIYIGTVLHPAANLIVRMYADFFRHRWITYTTAAPANGHEYFTQLDHQISGGWNSYIRYFYEQKPVKANGAFTKINLDQIRQKLRFQLDGQIGEHVATKSRVEWAWYSHDQHSQGFLAFQEIGLKSLKTASSWRIRLAYFNTDNYDSRIYAYESDLLYQFSVPALYGKGFRFYVNGKVKICENIEMWMKVSRSWFIGVDHIGSGYSEIVGNKRTEVKFQLRFKF